MSSFLRRLLSGTIVFLAILPCEARDRAIKHVQPVTVTCPVGTVPRLPWQVWVKYTDGFGEFRQVRWDIASKGQELEAADSTLHPAGSQYLVSGVVIGDNTTSDGFPIEAEVRIVGETYRTPAPQPVARTLSLADVRLTGSNRLTGNRDLDIREILSWDVGQQLYNYRDTYGLPTEGYAMADGWDSPTTKLKGHGTGHYLSALAFAFASSTDESVRAQLRNRMRRMVDEMRQCQERTFVWNDFLGRYWEARDYAPATELSQMEGTWEAFDRYKKDYAHYGYGYLNAIPAAHPVLVECYRPYNNEEWVWAPYYTIHKQLAGLIDVADNVDEKGISDKALLIAKDMGLWVWNRLHYRTYVQAEGSKEERRSRQGNRYEMWNMYIAGEVGGMAESLSRLSEMVSDAEESSRLLEAAGYFDAPAFFDPLSRNIDDIRTRHANQHIPMVTGALRSYRGNGNPYYYNLALNFWNLVQGRYVYATGGVGNGEMFRQPYTQILSMNTNTGPDMNETCCAYNLAKLTKDLNCYDPDNATFMDYYERVLYNQIVGSVHPTRYGVCYQYAVGLNAVKPFGNETPQSTCCGGTGAENHVKYQEAAYFVDDTTLWVALYLPTQVIWRERGVSFRQECEWPAERSRIVIERGGDFVMKLRVPYWTTEGFEVRLNGKPIIYPSMSAPPEGEGSCSSYLVIPRRQWQEGDVVEITMPYAKHISFGPDKMDLARNANSEGQTNFTPEWVGALMMGPLVMASPDIHTWQEADFHLSPDLRELKVERSNSQLSIVNCQLGNASFLPDYAIADQRATHYLRLHVGKDRHGRSAKKQGGDGMKQLVLMARERLADPSAWAPHGFARMKAAMEKGDAAELKTALSTMRPANLAEPEDLSELLALSAKAKSLDEKSEALREAIQYADMVVHYVNDGSGTPDLIRKATHKLRTAMQ